MAAEIINTLEHAHAHADADIRPIVSPVLLELASSSEIGFRFGKSSDIAVIYFACFA